jgi:uncharacterized protein YbaR (Trm112 family)
MPIDKKLLEILRCPVTKQQIFPLTETQLSIINKAIDASHVFHADGSPVSLAIKEGLITENQNRIYRIEQGIPIMLEDESILTNQLKEF